VGDEGVEAVDRHFLCGHHHPADRRGSLPRRATSSPAGAGGTSGAATASWIGRWWWGEEEEVGRGKRACVSSLSISLGESWAFAFVGFPFPMDDFAPGAVGIYVCVFFNKRYLHKSVPLVKWIVLFSVHWISRTSYYFLFVCIAGMNEICSCSSPTRCGI
jgi:hypothetical protein